MLKYGLNGPAIKTKGCLFCVGLFPHKRFTLWYIIPRWKVGQIVCTGILEFSNCLRSRLWCFVEFIFQCMEWLWYLYTLATFEFRHIIILGWIVCLCFVEISVILSSYVGSVRFKLYFSTCTAFTNHFKTYHPVRVIKVRERKSTHYNYHFKVKNILHMYVWNRYICKKYLYQWQTHLIHFKNLCGVAFLIEDFPTRGVAAKKF